MTTETLLPSEEVVTINQLLDAIEKNGWKQHFGGLFDDPNMHYDELRQAWPEYTGAACAMGQGVLNLGFGMLSGRTPEVKAIWRAIMVKNDKEHKDIPTIVREIKEEFPNDLEQTFIGKRYIGWTTMGRPL